MYKKAKETDRYTDGQKDADGHAHQLQKVCDSLNTTVQNSAH